MIRLQVKSLNRKIILIGISLFNIQISIFSWALRSILLNNIQYWGVSLNPITELALIISSYEILITTNAITLSISIIYFINRLNDILAILWICLIENYYIYLIWSLLLPFISVIA